jgi:hypothetical protein
MSLPLAPVSTPIPSLRIVNATDGTTVFVVLKHYDVTLATHHKMKTFILPIQPDA